MRRTPRNAVVFGAAGAGMLLFGVCLITLGAVAPSLHARFSLDAIATGTLFSILPFGILTGSALFGPICDRYGYRLLLILACVVMSAGFQGIAWSSSLLVLKICIYLFGLGGGIINGATNAVVADISKNNKGANLSLLGVFFGLGALGMPLVLAALQHVSGMQEIVSGTGWFTLLVGVFYFFIDFPPAKQTQGAIATGSYKKLFEGALLLIALFLFLQSSLEAIINNWTTTYLISIGGMMESQALYALSIHIIGMVLMRLVTGSLLRKVPQAKILWICLTLLMLGILLMLSGKIEALLTAGLFLSGAGLSGGFPIMLGFVGERFATLSATAFSFVFTIALIGNMLVNYLMGIIVHHYGVRHLVTVSFMEVALMGLLFFFITKKLTLNKK